MVIRPYRVRYLNDSDGESYTEHVVFCEHRERAIWLALYLRAKIRRRREIERLIQSGKAWSERVELWCFRPRVNFGVAAREVLCHAAREKDARLIGKKAYSIHTELDEFMRADELAMLQALSDEELCWQCRYVWGGLNSALLKERVPAVVYWLRRPAHKRSRPIPKHGRNDAIKSLRLAMELDWYGVPPDRPWPDGKGVWRPMEFKRFNEEERQMLNIRDHDDEPLRRRLRRIHHSNLDMKHIMKAVDVDLDPGWPVHGPERDEALRAIARAYGFNPSSMSVEDMFLLFAKGPHAIEKASVI